MKEGEGSRLNTFSGKGSGRQNYCCSLFTVVQIVRFGNVSSSLRRQDVCLNVGDRASRGEKKRVERLLKTAREDLPNSGSNHQHLVNSRYNNRLFI